MAARRFTFGGKNTEEVQVMLASFSHLHPGMLENLLPELTVFLFPVGGLESHGPHLPLGTKLFQAEDLALLLAQKMQTLMPEWNFIIMPVLPLTVDGVTSKTLLSVRGHVVRDALVDQGDALKRLGFMHFAVVSGQASPRQLSAIEDAGRILGRKKWFFYGKKANLVSITSAQIQAVQIWKSPMIALPTEHGGARDTGWILKINRTLVSPDFLTLPEVKPPTAGFQHFYAYFNHQMEGYWGKPAQASPELVQEELGQSLTSIALHLRPVFEQNQGQSFFQSGYRYFPLNGSFFKAYFLALIFFVLMLFWLLWSVRGIYAP